LEDAVAKVIVFSALESLGARFPCPSKKGGHRKTFTKSLKTYSFIPVNIIKVAGTGAVRPDIR
jgi:hypothetical protein